MLATLLLQAAHEGRFITFGYYANDIGDGIRDCYIITEREAGGLKYHRHIISRAEVQQAWAQRQDAGLADLIKSKLL